jgi:hypothetical protein
MTREEKVKKLEVSLSLMRVPHITNPDSIDILVSRDNIKHVDRIENLIRKICGDSCIASKEYPDKYQPQHSAFAPKSGLAFRLVLQLKD